MQSAIPCMSQWRYTGVRFLDSSPDTGELVRLIKEGFKITRNTMKLTFYYSVVISL